jgi:hypothetical protein
MFLNVCPGTATATLNNPLELGSIPGLFHAAFLFGLLFNLEDGHFPPKL